MEGFYRKENRTKKLSARKNEISLRESKSSGDNGFSLAELQCFHWLDLLLGKKKSSFCWSSKVVAFLVQELKMWPFLLGSLTELTVGVIDDIFLFELPLWDFPSPILLGVSFINFHRTKLSLRKIIYLSNF